MKYHYIVTFYDVATKRTAELEIPKDVFDKYLAKQPKDCLAWTTELFFQTVNIIGLKVEVK